MLETIDFTDLEKDLSEKLSPKRFTHSKAVAQTCLLLQERYSEDLDTDQLYYGGLMHDIAREWPAVTLQQYAIEHALSVESEELTYPALLHAPVGADLVKELGFGEEVCKAVRYHTLGSIEMGRMGLVLYIADYIEPNRTHLDDAKRSLLLSRPSLETLCMDILEAERNHLASKGRSVSASGQRLYELLEGGGRL